MGTVTALKRQGKAGCTAAPVFCMETCGRVLTDRADCPGTGIDIGIGTGTGTGIDTGIDIGISIGIGTESLPVTGND